MKLKNDLLKLDLQIFASDGEISFKVSLDDKGINNALNGYDKKASVVDKSLKKVGETGKKVFKATAMAVGTVSIALGSFVMESVNAMGDLEQQLGGSEAVFEHFAATVQKKGLEAYKVMGLSQNDYLATANKMGSLMQGAGLSVGKSMDLSTQAMQRAADVASVMGIDTSMAMESIAGAAKGNFTMMDNLGVAMNDTTLQAYALEKGITKSTQSMTNAEKVELAMQMFLEKTAKYAGNYAKENETFAGSFSTLKASIQNFMSGASDIGPVVESLTSFIEILIKNIGAMSPKLVEGIVQLVNNIMPQIPGIIKSLLPVIISGAIDLVMGFISMFPQLLTMLASMLPLILQSLIIGLVTIVNTLSNMLPTLIPIIIQAILTLIPMLLNNLPLFLNAGIQLIIGLANGLVNAIPILIDMLPQIIESLINGLMGAIPQLMLLGPVLMFGLAKGIIKAIPSLVSITPKIWKGLINGIKMGLKSFTSVGGDLIKGLWNGIKDKSKWITNKIKSLGKDILDSVKGIFGVHSPSTEFAYIGEMDMVGLGEGIEDMKPYLTKTINKVVTLNYDNSGIDFLKNGGINISRQFGSISPNYNNNQILNVDVIANLDVNKFGKVFVNDIKTFSGGAKNSYNYGGSY